MATMMAATDSPKESVATTYAPARTFAFAPGWEPAVLTDRGAAACRLSGFQDVFADLDAADRAWFAYWLSELLVEACDAEVALR